MPIRPPQITAPPAGVPIDQHFTLTLDDPPPDDGLSLRLGNATLVLSCRLLETLRDNKPPTWQTEEERIALIRGKRAEAILSHRSLQRDEQGYYPVSLPPSDDGMYLVSECLQAGQVAVINTRTNLRVSQIVVTFNATVAGPLAGVGHISYAFTPDDPPFLSLNWWVS